MRVLFDQQIFSDQHFGGISRYFTELFKELEKNENISANIISPLCTNHYARQISFPRRIGVPFPLVPRLRKPVKYFNQQFSRLFANYLKPDILHQTYYPRYTTNTNSGMKVVTTVYDMIHELFPRDFQEIDKTSECKTLAVRRADFVICISENTRRDLIRCTGIDKGKTAVVHLGVDHMHLEKQPCCLADSKPYLLYVGLRSAYKNFVGLLNIYAANPRLRNDFQIVCFGGGALTKTERNSLRKLDIPESNITQLAGDDRILSSLYQHATAFIYPSLYEGFGIPPLEAMMHHCPVVSSNAASLPEVLGSAAKFFDPADSDDFERAVMEVVYDSQRSEQLKALGFEQARKFTWEKCAERTAAIYSSLL